ncbi:uncharacterized protein LOC135399037 [Ornithodoros turicata]|uniref:uncharacterized protein LOC135399037 n=1 Tax=Ornithodoros turicata TaxID=34597 RepID=UPI003138E20E
MNEINMKIVLMALTCILVMHGPRADSPDVAELIVKLCSLNHQVRLDAVTCIGTATDSKFPNNLAKCARDTLGREHPLQDFGLTTMCSEVSMKKADAVKAAVPQAARTVLNCALSYSRVKTSQIKRLVKACVDSTDKVST